MASDGGQIDAIDGVAVPSFVVSVADRERWGNALKVAQDLLGMRPDTPAVAQMARTLFNDRQTYRD